MKYVRVKTTSLAGHAGTVLEKISMKGRTGEVIGNDGKPTTEDFLYRIKFPGRPEPLSFERYELESITEEEFFTEEVVDG
jgi:hypothetical protein